MRKGVGGERGGESQEGEREGERGGECVHKSEIWGNFIAIYLFLLVDHAPGHVGS